MINFFIRRTAIFVVFSTLFFLLSGCTALFGRDGYFRDRGDDYVKAVEIPPMKVPGDLDSNAIAELFVIPPISNEYVDQEKEFEVPRADFSVAAEKTQIKIQTLNYHRWISVNNSPGVVWPRVIRFFEEADIKVTLTDAATGQIETAWLTLKDNAGKKDRYQIRIEPGIHTDTTEIHVTQVTLAESTPRDDAINWPKRSINPEREKWLVNKLANYLAQEDSGGVSLLAQSIGGKQKVQWVQPYQGESFITFSMDFDRVWASVGGALERTPFAMVDMNRTEGYFFITYDPEPLDENAEKPGFFSRLFGFDKRAVEAHRRNLQPYRVLVNEHAEDDVRVYVKDINGQPVPSEKLQKLLQIIRNQLV